MPIVSNTSPILGLAAIHALHLLRQQFDITARSKTDHPKAAGMLLHHGEG